ncbi:MAG: type II toxin-antitoxin system PemK/MazF family toxin [Gemmatimonadaceae bacterium]|nr:type II toxin-antitoxin system PemK/MazF family toxin [Gemmatimonadaceae bacterium]
MGVVSVRPVRRGEVHLVSLDPACGQEIRKTRPCVVVSPDELNAHMGTFIVAPLTTGRHAYPFRVACRFAGKDGHVVLDQLRTVDRERLVQRLGALTAPTQMKILGVLQAMFAA